MQRKEYAEGKLADNKITQLESIGFDWSNQDNKKRKWSHEASDSSQIFRPPRTQLRCPSPENCIPTLTIVSTTDLRDVINGMETGTLNMAGAVARLKKMEQRGKA